MAPDASAELRVYTPGVRVEVKSERRTWLLILLAVLVSGAIALWRFAEREQEAPSEPRSGSDIVEVDVVE